MASRFRFRTRATALVRDLYAQLEAAAIAAARRNNAALWYVPDSLAGVYQDSAGTTLPALNAPIGLLLDRSFGAETLGPELLANGDFANGTTGYLSESGAAASVVGGNLRVTNGTASYGYSYVNFPTVAGKTYLLTTSRRGGAPTSTVNLHIYALGGAIALNLDAGNPRTFVALDAQTTIQLYAGGNTVGNYTDYGALSVREVILAENLGPELIVNSDFSAGKTGWSGADMSASGGTATLTATTQFASFVQPLTLSVGKVYRIKAEARLGTSTSAFLKARANSGTSYRAQDLNASGRCEFVFVPTEAASIVECQNLSTGLGTSLWDNISVREVLGYHATQATAANKPTLVRVPRKLGPELVVNGTFDTNANGWTAQGSAALSVVSGALRVTSAGGGNKAAYQAVQVTQGKAYWVSYSVTPSAYFYVGTGPVTGPINTPAGASGSLTQTFVAPGSTVYVNCDTNGNTVGSTVDWDNISVREVLEWSYVASFDGANDILMNATFPVPSGGASSTIIMAGLSRSTADQDGVSMGAGTPSTTNLREVGSQIGGAIKGSAGGDTQGPAGSALTPFVGTERYVSGVSSTLFGNGAVLSGGAANENSVAGGTVAIGGRFNNSTFWNGHIALACVAPVALPNEDRIAIERFAAYLAGANYVG